MNYIIVKDGKIDNIIVAEPEVAADLGALSYYPGAVLGDIYNPPHIYTDLEQTQIEITALQLSDIVQGQAVTELELMMIGGLNRV